MRTCDIVPSQALIAALSIEDIESSPELARLGVTARLNASGRPVIMSKKDKSSD